jgi:hypothetical protein
MSINNFIKNICTKLGNNNKSIYPMMAIAAANGICRPTFTMLKKGENPESKKYAALREGLTEVIAVPTYLISGELAAKFGKFIVSKAMDKQFQQEAKNGVVQNAKELAERKAVAIKRGQSGLMFLGVCTAAGLIIPALCSAVVTPIMDKLKPKNQTLDINTTSVNVPAKPIIQTPTQLIKRPQIKNFGSMGMKVGGV